MRILHTRQELRDELAGPRREGRTIGLVPTMGYLHAGHISLLEAARASCDVVVMSLFVNPAQFGAGEDLGRYPRDPDGDAAAAEKAGVDLIYAPSVEEVYPEGFSTSVEVGGLTEVLCGQEGRRGPEHFRGVTTIVAKLLNTVGPDVAYFGQKDAQQALVVGRMVRDLDFPTRIDVQPTVREPDGLAMSSRNSYLSPADRDRAPAIHRALESAGEAARAGAASDEVLASARRILDEAGIEPEYLEIRDAERLQPIETLNGRPAVIAVAARVGAARLIDNIIIEPSTTAKEGQDSR
jgi:pantoate--beta-alanine ligase